MQTCLNFRNYEALDRSLDGRAVSLRALRPDDKPILQDAMHHLAKQSRYFRFLIPKDELTDKELAYFTEIDFVHHVGLLASIEDNGHLMPAAIGRYILCEPHAPSAPVTAEAAFAVEEKFQGLGIGTILLKHLASIARAQGISELICLVHIENVKMLDVLRHCGMSITSEYNEAGTVTVHVKL